MKLNKPKALTQNSCLAVLAGSSALSSLFPHRVKQGIAALEKLGFRVKAMPSLSLSWNGSAGTPKERAADINQAFADSEVDGIIASIGGTTANQVLPLLDYDLIRKNPKVFIGYSDNSLFNYAFASQSSLVSFYGPCLISEFAEYPYPHDYTVEYFQKSVCSQLPIGIVRPSESWTDEFLDWLKKDDLLRPRKMTSNVDGHSWLQSGEARGPIIGGCLPSIMQLRGTKYDLDYRGKILFIETPEGNELGKGLDLNKVDAYLMDLRLGGVFDQIIGLIIGRGYGYTEEQHLKFRKILEWHLSDYKFPVLFNTNIGHAAPIITVPLMMEASLSSSRDEFSILESGVS